MILDDFQWTDQGSMEILYDIWLRIASVPLLVVACFREGEISPEHPLARYRALARSNNLPTRELTLEALTESDMEGLLGALLRTPARWNGELAAFVAGKSGGNPLFALEITRQLAEKEVLTWRGGGWRFNRELLEKVNIPDRMADAILCHIGSLDAELADLLSVCSLLGKRFGVDFLLSLPGIGDAERVVGLLETAVERELVEWDRRRSGSLLFLHDRIREAFAGRLSPERTRSVHGLIAAAVEKLPPAPENETLFLLVHHFSLSGDWRRCLPYSLKAAERARSANAVSSAIRFFELSLRLLEENSLRGSAEWSTAAHGLIELYPVTGEVKKAGALAEALLAFAKTPTERARLHRIIGINHTRVSSYDRAERNFSTGLKLLGKRIPRSKLTTALFIATELALYPLIALLWPVRRNVARREVTVREREIASLYENASLLFVVSDYFKFFWVTLRLMNFARRRMGVSRELANAVAWYGMSFLAVSWISRSLTHLNRALAMRSSIGDRAGGADDHNWLGFAHSINAEWDKALRHLTAARETCEAIGDYYRLVHVLNGLQNLHYHHTDAEKRLAVLRQMLSVSEVIGSRYGAAVALSGLGGHYLMTGDFDASGSFLENAIEAATSAGQWLIVCIAQCNMGRLLLERRDLDGALRFVDAAAETERTHSLLRPVVAFRYFAMIEVLCARLTAADAPSSGGKRRRELKVLRKEIGRMNRTTRRWPLWRGDALLARAQFFAAAGPARKAEAGFRAAAVVLGKTGKRYELARCSYHFAEFLLAEGRTGEAAPLLRSALDAFRHIGARPYVERTLRLLGSPPEPAAGAPAADAQRLASLLEVSRSLGSLHELDALLKEILERAVETTGAGGGYLFLTGDTGQCELRVSRHAPPSEAAAPTFSKSVVDQVRDSGRTVLAFNAAHQESFKRFESVSANEMKSILCAPIMRRGRVLGVCYLDNSFASGVFDAGDRELLEAFMALAAVCIENARSFEELRSRNRMLADEGEQIKKRNAELQTIVQFQASHLRSFGDVNLVTQDSAMAELVAKANRFAESQAPVLITGPSGSGKEIFAHLIHFSGRRKDGPFVKVNCSAIPETLFESEFFGYEKGAFTGAAAARKGKFELAHGGTLMLDEIAELPPSQQAKLLRVLEEREITPVGGAAPRPVDVRVVAATNRSLPLLVSEGTFRQDLFFRLGVLTLAVPSLSCRPGDIPVLATYFLASVANAEGGREKRFDDNALVALSKMPFEGNVRQLKNLVYQLYVGVDGEIITAGDVVQCEKDERQQPAADDAGTISDLDSGLPRGFLEKTMPFGDMKELFERRYLNVQLEKHDFSLTLTSKALGLLPSSLSRKLKDLGISVKKAKG
jgi:transcriptional regulator with GAF, ATPase, and Fis domain/tetratricopeptide (TPR) repeat protein